MNKAILSLLSTQRFGGFPLSLCQHRNDAELFTCVVTSGWKTDKHLVSEDFMLTKHFNLFFFLIDVYFSSDYLKQQQQMASNMAVEQKVLLDSHKN